MFGDLNFFYGTSVENLQNWLTIFSSLISIHFHPRLPWVLEAILERATQCLIFLLFASRDTPLRRSLISLRPTTTACGRRATKAGREKTSSTEGNPSHPQQQTIVNGLNAVIIDQTVICGFPLKRRQVIAF